MVSMTRQSDMVTQDDVTFDDMVMEKYHLKDQKLFSEKQYLAMEIFLREQASNDLVNAKLNEEVIYI